MLVLTRRPDDTIVLSWGGQEPLEGVVTIKILGVEGIRVKVGIDAPEYVSIVRGEVWGRSSSASPSD